MSKHPDNNVKHEPDHSEASQSMELAEWKASRQVMLILLCLAGVSLIVALDATILVPALTVCCCSLNLADEAKIAH